MIGPLVKPEDRDVLIGGIIAAVILNIVLGLISWWRCYANNYLHWGALATWCLLLVQGRDKYFPENQNCSKQSLFRN